MEFAVMHGTGFSTRRPHWEPKVLSGAPDVAFSVSGRWYQVLRAIPMIDANTEQPADLWVLPECRRMQKFLESQDCIHRVLFSPVSANDVLWCSHPPACLPVYGRYREVIRLDMNDSSLIDGGHEISTIGRLAQLHGLRPPSPHFRFRLCGAV